MPKNLSIQPGLFEPELTIRRSNRAKYLRLKTHHEHGIEVVVPSRMSLKHVAPFVRQHQDWINQQLDKHNKRLTQPLPEEIYLQALGQGWTIQYNFGDYKNFRIQEAESIITISGPNEDKIICRRKLNQWLRIKAKSILPGWLKDISTRIDLPGQKVFVRSQRTCWGSCSHSNNINLNDRLLFLPPDIVEYVITHELCHTRHMNHSKHFWNLVRRHCPEYKILEKQLKNSQHTIPHWAH